MSIALISKKGLGQINFQREVAKTRVFLLSFLVLIKLLKFFMLGFSFAPDNKEKDNNF